MFDELLIFCYRYFSLKDGIFIVSASIRVVAESLISATLFTRIVSASSISGNIVGIYSGLTKLDYQNEVTFSTAGTIQLSKSYPLSFYFYMQNAGKYRILSGSRISVVLAEVKYPAFHATLDTNVSAYVQCHNFCHFFESLRFLVCLHMQKTAITLL